MRHHLGTRYDARDGVFDWDYHMRLGEMVGCPPVVGPVTGSGARGTHTGGDHHEWVSVSSELSDSSNVVQDWVICYAVSLSALMWA